MPRVSVVILTRNRPQTVLRAVADALGQTLRDLEVIVVIDGQDEATAAVLAGVGDPRLRVVQHATNRGISEARNTGFREALGEYVALQDDDDEWLPRKLALQVEAADAIREQHHGALVFSFCRYLERTSEFENSRPEKMPAQTDTGKRFVDYMYCDRGLIVPCVVMVSRALALRYPFDPALQPAEDSDFFIRCTADAQVQLALVDEVLAIHNNYPPASAGEYRMSSAGRWRGVLAWAIRQRALFTGRSFAFLLTRSITQMARDQGATLREKLSILSAALLLGSLSPRAVLYFLASAWLSKRSKHRIRRLLSSSARAKSVPVQAPRGVQHG